MQYRGWLTHRYREQARSHRLCGWQKTVAAAQITVGARLAREEAVTFNIDVG